MFNNVVLDVFIGLIFVYLLYSLLATILQEMLARMLSLRSRNLLQAIRVMLEDRIETQRKFLIWCKVIKYAKYIFAPLVHFYSPFNKKDNFAKAFYDHPSIKYLGENESKSKPSYIKPENFSQTIIQLLRGNTYDGTTPQMNLIYNTLFVNKSFITHKNKNILIDKDTLLQFQQLYNDAYKDIDRFKIILENWYNETMDRASGWYKKKTQFILLLLGFVITVLFNVDTISIFNLLSKDKSAREQMVQMAISSVPKYDSLVRSSKKQSNDNSKAHDTFYVTSDTILKKAYNIVNSDIDKANSIAGLGWPLRDSCNKYANLLDTIRNRRNSFLAKRFDTTAIGNAISKAIDSLKPKTSKTKKKSVTTNPIDKDSLYKLVISYISNAKDSVTKKFEKDSSDIIEHKKGLRCEKCLIGNPYQQNWGLTLLGWFLTSLAISLGAPFWFDMLSKIIQLRGTGPKPTTTDPNNITAANNAPGSSPTNRVG